MNVGNISSVVAEDVAVGVGCDEGLLCLACNIPETFFGKMRNVNDDSEVFAFFNYFKSKVGKTVVGVVASAYAGVSLSTESENAYTRFVKPFKS